MLLISRLCFRADFSLFLMIILVSLSLINVKGQSTFNTIFPVRLDDNFGCFNPFVQPTRYTVYNEPFSAGDTRTPLATFEGGIPVGRNGRSCHELYGYASVKKFGIATTLPSQVKITFPTPRNFENIFIEGEKNKVLTVTLNGSVSKQITLQSDLDIPYSDYGKYSLWAYEFPFGSTRQISQITVSSSDLEWKFAVYSISLEPTRLGGGNPPNPPGNPQNPVIFVPGIAGSGLSLADTDERRWLPALNPCKLYDLTLQDGNSLICGSYSPQNVRVDDAIRTQTLGGVYSYEVYSTFIDRIISTGGYREYDFDNNPYNRTLAGCQQRRNSYPSNLPTPTLFVFAYDWRKSNFENANALKQYVQCARLFHPNKQVTIIAHSMGGLLSRNYILQNHNNHHIDKLITIGSPFLGTPKGLQVLQTGEFLPFFYDPYTYSMAQTLKNLIEFYPGGHELLSSQAYFNGVYPLSPVSVREYPWRGEINLSYFSTRTWIDDKHPVSRPATRSELFHNYLNSQRQSQDNWQNDQTNVEYFHIYGWQRHNKTIGKVTIEKNTLCGRLEIQCSSYTRYNPTPSWGDGTVALESSKRVLGVGKDYNYKLQNNSQPYRFFENPPVGGDDFTADHNGMLKNSRVTNRIIKILQPGFLVSEDDMSASDCGTYTSPIDCRELNLRNTKIGDFPSPSHYVSMHNTGNFRIRNISWSFSGEKHLFGFSSEDNVEKVPTGENSMWLAMPGEGLARRIDFRTNSDPIEIQMIRGSNYENIEKLIIFKDLLLQPDKKVEIFVIPGGQVLFNYYVNGDDQSPIEVVPTLIVEGTMAKDINSPIISYNYQNTANGKIVSFSASDDLAGVRQIRYSLDGQTFSAYTAPIQVNFSQTTIYAFAEDNNLNRTGIAEFDINGQSYSIGNRVWFDTNNDGKINFDGGFGEEGSSGVSLSLFEDNNLDGQPDDLSSPISSTVTDALGYYRFDNLTSGNYVVRVNPENFADNGTLKGYRNTTGNSSSNLDSDDSFNGENGIEPTGHSNLIQTVGVLSNTITINTGVNEPVGETDTAFSDNEKVDGLLNSTVDFGFYRIRIGGTIWEDTGNGSNRNNGILDNDETGRGNMRVRLFYGNGQEVPVGSDGILGTSDDMTGEINNPDSGGVITDSSGNYFFDGLLPNQYFIKVFRNGFTSSAIFFNNPNDNVDSDNNGVNGGGINDNFIVSSVFNHNAGEYGLLGNTSVNNEDGNTTDSTIDFGLLFSPTAASASISGKVKTQSGIAVSFVRITLTKSNGEVLQTVTNGFGTYNFAELETGETYILSANHKKHNFSPSSRIVTLMDNATEIDFVAAH